MNWPCPVCGKETIQEYVATLDEQTICELREACPSGCQEYEQAYGNYRERIGNKIWEWHWTETVPDMRKRHWERLGEIAKEIEKRTAGLEKP